VRTGGARRDPHPGRDQPGVLPLRDPDQHLDLARGEHPQQPAALVVGLLHRVEQFGEGGLEELGRDGHLTGPGLHHRALHALDALVVPDVPGGPGREGGGDAAGAGDRSEDHHRGLRALPPDPDDRVEGPGHGGRRGPEQADLRGPSDDQVGRPGGGRGGGQHPVAAQFQRRGERLGEQSVVVDHHEPDAHLPIPLPTQAPRPSRACKLHARIRAWGWNRPVPPPCRSPSAQLVWKDTTRNSLSSYELLRGALIIVSEMKKWPCS